MTKLHGILNGVVVFLLGCTVAGAQTGQVGEEPDFYHYVRSIGPMPLKLNTEKIGIRFQPGVSEEDQANVLLSEDALDPLAELTPVSDNGTLLVGLKPGAARATVLETIQRLSAADAVYYASPVVQSKIGFDEMVTNKFYVSLPSSTPSADIDVLNEEQHVETVALREFPKRATTGWTLRITKNSTLNAIGMSNLYYEQLGGLGASPGLICLYPIFASDGPDTYSYFNANCDQPKYSNQCYLCAIYVREVWNSGAGITGSPNIIVAVLDTGVDLEQPDLQENLMAGHDYVDDDNTPQDTNGHGTCSAGVIGAVTYNSLGVAGIAGGWGESVAGCKIMPLKVSNDVPANPKEESPGVTYLENVTEAIAYAANNGAHVLSMSFGFWAWTADLQDAVDAAADAGCIMVACTHNYDDEVIENPTWQWPPYLIYPACIKEVISVGALNMCLPVQRKYGSSTGCTAQSPTCNPPQGGPPGATYWGSDYGTALDIMAPGLAVWTTDIVGMGGYTQSQSPAGDYNVGNPGTYNKTSSATPQVAGVAALVLSATLDANGNPTLSRAQVQAILEFSADDLQYNREYHTGEGEGEGEAVEAAGPGRDVYTGYGRVNAEAAVSLALAHRFVIRNSAGKHLASFDAEGNFIVEGDLISSATPGQLDATSDKEFIVRHGTSDELVRLNSSADVYIKGKLYERVTVDLDTAVTVDSLRFRDSTGDTVALVNSASFNNSSIEPTSPYTVPAGSIILKGRAFVGAEPDRDSSQGH